MAPNRILPSLLSALVPYVLVLVAIAVAAGVRSSLDAYFGSLLPFVFFFPVIAFSAYLGGRALALFAMAVSTVLANYLYVEPRYQLMTQSMVAWLGSLAYVVSSLTVIIITDMMRSDRKRAEAFGRQVEDDRQRLLQEASERQRREAELRNSEAKFRAVAQTAGHAIYIHDGSKLVFVNPAAEGITGYSAEELLRADMWQMVHPEFREQVMANARARFRGEPCPQRYEYMIIRKDGTPRWLDFSANLVDFEGQKCILATAFDVTDRKHAEMTLRKTEKLAATGRLAASIAHEINNPLEAVTNLLYLMRTDSDNLFTYLALAEQELRRVAHLTKQTLGFYRETSQRVRVDVAGLIEEVMSVYSSKLAQRRIRTAFQLDPDCTINGFPGELRQVFSNLVANAVDAMDDGGRLQVRVRCVSDPRNERRGVRVTIADNGSGIPERVVGHIYEPFFTTKEEVGTGLGLWVTKGIVDKHEGVLRVRSRTGSGSHGTVFMLFLPSTAENERGAAA